eukprot:COSAG04_NODE_1430_length_6798_cov_9.576205_3_plen_331_part_00
MSANSFVNRCIKLNLALCAGTGAVAKQEVQQSLPSPEQLAEFARKSPDTIGGDVQSAPAGGIVSPHLLAALVCEKYEMDDEALTFAAVIHDLDPNLGGDPKPTSHILGYCVKGRVLARRGQPQAAGAAFEEAVSQSEKYELWLLAAFALRDLKLYVLDGMGHGDHGSRRLGAVLRRLKGPASSLSALLDGLDAGELMALDAPRPGYEVVFAPDEPTNGAEADIRRELQALKIMTLYRRAAKEGLDSALTEEAMESEDPKGELIALFLAARADKVGEQEARLRKELEGLRLMQLHKRALAAGVEEAAVEDAMDGRQPKVVLIELVLARGVA